MLIKRSVAYLVDSIVAFAIFAATQLALFGPLRHALGISDDEFFRSGWNTELYTLLTISSLVLLYFALPEKSRWQATPGKRLLGLKTAGQLGWGSAAARAAVKLLPWELAHVANNFPSPVWYSDDPGFRWMFIAPQVLLVAYVVTVLVDRKSRAPHDFLAGTQVVTR